MSYDTEKGTVPTFSVKQLLDVIEEKKEPKEMSEENRLKLQRLLNPNPNNAKVNFNINVSMCRSELELIQFII